MSVTNSKIKLPQEEIMSDIKETDESVLAAESVDMDKLAQLKAKLEAQKQTAKADKVEKKEKTEKVKSVNFGIIGTGQAGNNLASIWYSYGYDVLCLNTARVDLDNIQVPVSNKILLDNQVGGAAKSLELGEQAAVEHAEKIKEAVDTQLANSEVLVLISSLGGGSGAGSLPVLIDILSTTGKPIIVMGILPQTSDDGLSKNNSLVTLNKVSKMAQAKKVSAIVCIDNAKIEQIYHDANQLDFFKLANQDIVSKFHAMNCLANTPGITKSIDKMEWLKMMLDGEGYAIYGSVKVDKYDEELDITEALMMNLENNLLSGSFDIKQAKYCGIFMSANETVWKNIPSSSVNYCISCVNSDFAAPLGVFKGTYIDNSVKEDCLMIHFFYSGLGLPVAKIDALKQEVDKLNAAIKSKSENRSISLEFDLGSDKTLSKAEEIKAKIANKNSNFSKFISSTIDRRNK